MWRKGKFRENVLKIAEGPEIFPTKLSKRGGVRPGIGYPKNGDRRSEGSAIFSVADSKPGDRGSAPVLKKPGPGVGDRPNFRKKLDRGSVIGQFLIFFGKSRSKLIGRSQILVVIFANRGSEIGMPFSKSLIGDRKPGIGSNNF